MNQHSGFRDRFFFSVSRHEFSSPRFLREILPRQQRKDDAAIGRERETDDPTGKEKERSRWMARLVRLSAGRHVVLFLPAQQLSLSKRFFDTFFPILERKLFFQNNGRPSKLVRPKIRPIEFPFSSDIITGAVRALSLSLCRRPPYYIIVLLILGWQLCTARQGQPL